jgi:hypothetical protein
MADFSQPYITNSLDKGHFQAKDFYFAKMELMSLVRSGNRVSLATSGLENSGLMDQLSKAA